ncbi:peptidoglycan-binding protein [Cronobacter sakazakii]|uniref:peptidoglycan-binding protein n=1 Tax=Cronobacter TaxID=413496 RepID=UPI00084E1B2F|nr:MULTISPECIES: peptidoglycan-binding protein [Cronobacter]EJG0601344.1 peptidoglycan-binding protein [Cronobacter sakazakii]EJG0608955.1 peptidoglycan-binding protein [Cronobacter sakazakii]EJG0609328.1 peptidoglycan-binding protein [Cronobacter sakazakii]EJG0613192.1 peptidoglycan-binding protein [Cronobacter sakazakii]EJG0613602.1 peptidoglycan-binding protein [Cronobacter sakazakii]
MPKRHYPNPRVFRLTGSVGFCGTNNPDEVKTLQKLIADAGYSQTTGRYITVNGRCDLQTQEAIYWYQRLLNMKPSGLIHPVDYWFMHALHEATTPRWRPRHVAGPLIVRQGQTTFDSEGVDYITAVAPFRQPKHLLQFSRILHHPRFESGVTLGRGFDMKKRSAGEIIATLRHADIEEYKAVICSKAAYLTGREAEMFVQFYGPLVGEITHQQQIRLFEIAYQEKVIYAKGVYDRHARHLNIPNALPWSRIDTVIRDTFIDTIFQGNVTANEMVAIIAKGGSRNEIITYLRNDVSSRRDAQRTQIRIRNLQK